MSRKLVLNGLTARVESPLGGAGAAAEEAHSPDPTEFYHELELYRQLMALQPASTPQPPPAPPQPPRSPAPPLQRSASCQTLSAPRVPPSRSPPPHPVSDSETLTRKHCCVAPEVLPIRYPVFLRPAIYLGSFPVAGDEQTRDLQLTEQLRLMKESGRAEPVLLQVALSGIKICRPHDQSVRMSHALRRISFATCEPARALFAFVARSPRARAHHYCHAFAADTPDQAEELNALVGDAFRMAFASQLQPCAPPWVSSAGVESERGSPARRAPASLPGLARHYACEHRSPSKCELMGASPLNESSPSSSEESSPTEVSSYRRLGGRGGGGGGGGGAGGERPRLMRRLRLGALLPPDDDDSTPLVTDTPTTPTTHPVCVNGGYMNEAAAEAEARTRESNREPSPIDHRLDIDFNKHSIKSWAESGVCSGAASSSSGASSCGASSRSGNNNTEPELHAAHWFQAGIPREIALEVLSSQPVGSFLVRRSASQAGCFALSVRVPREFARAPIAHYLILATPKGYKIKGFTKEFSSLSALVTHHSVMPELLPCPLLARRPPPAPHRAAHPAHAPHAPHAPHPARRAHDA